MLDDYGGLLNTEDDYYGSGYSRRSYERHLQEDDQDPDTIFDFSTEPFGFGTRLGDGFKNMENQ